MAENKTTRNNGDVAAFLNAIGNRRRADDAKTVVAIMEKVTGCPPEMWGTSIIGFDQYDYVRKDKSEHSFMIVGLSPRKAALTVYIMTGFSKYQNRLKTLGKHKHSSSCLYLPNLADIDLAVLEEIIADSVRVMRDRYHGQQNGTD